MFVVAARSPPPVLVVPPVSAQAVNGLLRRETSRSGVVAREDDAADRGSGERDLSDEDWTWKVPMLSKGRTH